MVAGRNSRRPGFCSDACLSSSTALHIRGLVQTTGQLADFALLPLSDLLEAEDTSGNSTGRPGGRLAS